MDAELKTYLENMEGRIVSDLKTRVSQECERFETKLLRAFRDWARPMEIHNIEGRIGGAGGSGGVK